eukprot:4618929-Amphidinium_carterae.1
MQQCNHCAMLLNTHASYTACWPTAKCVCVLHTAWSHAQHTDFTESVHVHSIVLCSLCWLPMRDPLLRLQTQAGLHDGCVGLTPPCLPELVGVLLKVSSPEVQFDTVCCILGMMQVANYFWPFPDCSLSNLKGSHLPQRKRRPLDHASQYVKGPTGNVDMGIVPRSQTLFNLAFASKCWLKLANAIVQSSRQAGGRSILPDSCTTTCNLDGVAGGGICWER